MPKVDNKAGWKFAVDTEIPLAINRMGKGLETINNLISYMRDTKDPPCPVEEKRRVFDLGKAMGFVWDKEDGKFAFPEGVAKAWLDR